MGKKKEKVLTPEQLKNDRLAQIFYACRRVLKMNQTEFALYLGVTQGTISKIESRDMKPEYYLVCHLCKLLKLNAQGVMDYSMGEGNSIPVKGYKELLAEEAELAEEKEKESKGLRKTSKKPGRKSKYPLNSPFEEFKNENKGKGGGWLIGGDE